MTFRAVGDEEASLIRILWAGLVAIITRGNKPLKIKITTKANDNPLPAKLQAS